MVWTPWKRHRARSCPEAASGALIELRNGVDRHAPLKVKGLRWTDVDRAEVRQCLSRPCIVLAFGRVLKRRGGQPCAVSPDSLFLGVFDPLPAGALESREVGGPTARLGTYDGYLEDVFGAALALNPESPLRAMEDEIGSRLNFGFGRFGFLYANERNVRFAARRLAAAMRERER